MAMDEQQAKAQQIRKLLLPGLRGIADSLGIGDEVNLICTREGTISLTTQSARHSNMWPLFTAQEIKDDSYKTHFRERVEKLLKA
jgi:hypothetical protein